MAGYADELLFAAASLIERRPGRAGKLSSALVRRSISTCYYALFHFLVEEAATRLVGSGNGLRRRRRVLARSFGHAGMKSALDRIRGAAVDPAIADFLRPGGPTADPSDIPRFARTVADVFDDAQTKRHAADYDLNKPMSEADARILHGRVELAIERWRAAGTRSDRDFKHALCVLMLLRGRLRQDP